MADNWFEVELDLEKIRQTLSRDDRTDYPLEYVRNWLADAGFVPHGPDRWLVRERDLGQVDPSEVLSLQDHPGPPPSHLD